MNPCKCFLLVALVTQCIHAQIPGLMMDIQIQSQGLLRNFYIFLPSSWTPTSDPVPVVLNFHGFTSNPLEQAVLTRANDYAQQYGWAIVYPTGVDNSFNAGGCCGNAAALHINDVQFARDIISHLETRGVRVRRDAIFSIGMSNGGMMSHRMACDGADLVSAVGPNAGRQVLGGDLNSCNPVRSIPVISITGTNDFLVSYEGNGMFPSFAQDLTNVRNSMECNMTEPPCDEVITPTTTCQVFSQCNQNAFTEYCTVVGGGHTWYYAPTNIDATGYFFMRFAQITPGLVPKPFLDLKPEVEPRMPYYFE